MTAAGRHQFSLALGLSAGVNVCLFFLIAWSMAVTQGLTGRPPFPVGDTEFQAALEEPPDVVSLVLSPGTESAAPPKREIVQSPDDQLATPPPDPATTRFISSANLRAASEEAASPDGIAGLATQQGLDKPSLDLRDSDFRDGEEKDTAPAPADGSPPAPVPARESTPDKPEQAPAPELADQSETSDASKETPPDPNLKPETTPLSSPPAFRDNTAETILPLPLEKRPSPPRFRQSAPTPAPPEPPVLTRIPDRVPESTYRPGTRKSKQLGTISNKGRSSVDAVATAEGRFGKLIRTAIEKGWRRRMLGLSGLANPGLVEVEFEVDPKGRISNVKLANPGEANPVMQDCALSAVIDAKLPAPPAELFEELQDNLTGGRMRCSFSFLIY